MFKKRISIFLLTLYIILNLVSCSSTPVEITETVEIGGMFVAYSSFEEAFDKADVVVYGEITELKASHFPSWDINKWFCKTPVVLDVIKCIKGDITDTITFESMGGVIGNTKYVTDAYPTDDFEIGSKVLVFLLLDDRDNAYTCISPNTAFLEDENGEIQISTDLLPDTYSVEEPESGTILSVSVDIDDVIELIENDYELYQNKNNVTE